MHRIFHGFSSAGFRHSLADSVSDGIGNHSDLVGRRYSWSALSFGCPSWLAPQAAWKGLGPPHWKATARHGCVRIFIWLGRLCADTKRNYLSTRMDSASSAAVRLPQVHGRLVGAQRFLRERNRGRLGPLHSDL